MFKKVELPYSTKDLSPVLDEQTVDLHYNKHHEGYIQKLNTAVEEYQPELFETPLIEILLNLDMVRDEIKTVVINNGGQAYNHNLYWSTLSPNGGGMPSGELAKKIEETFGSFEDFKKQFNQETAKQFGSGWGWLSVDVDGNLQIETTANAENPLMQGRIPIFGVDVWEHAYYINYHNRRPDYLEKIWDIVNWTQVEKNYSAVVIGKIIE